MLLKLIWRDRLNPTFHVDPNYLLKAVQGFQNQGFPIYAVGIQVRQTNDDLIHFSLLILCRMNLKIVTLRTQRVL